MSGQKDVEIWETPHECRARDGGPVGIRLESCGDGEQEVIYSCAASGICPYKGRRPGTDDGPGTRS